MKPQRKGAGAALPGRAILDLSFTSQAKPWLGFEIFRLSELYSRKLDHRLDTPKRHHFHMVFYGLRDRDTHQVDFAPCPLAPHQLLFVAEGRVHQFGAASSADAWMLLFTPEFLALSSDARAVEPLRASRVLSTLWSPPAVGVPTSERRDFLALIDLLRTEYSRPADPLQAALLSALLRAFLLRAERLAARTELEAGRPPAPAELERFRTSLESEFAATRSVAHYARATGLSLRGLNALTRRYLGRSAKDSISDRVVLEIKRLLAHTDLSVKEIAARTGFGDPTNLVKFFRRHTGQTPLAFRSQSLRTD